MRLTEKEFVKKDYDIHEYDYQECINKLGQLEDIEDELGIDLITLFKALKQGFAYKFVQNDYNELYKKGFVKRLIISALFKYGEDYRLTLYDTLTCEPYCVFLKDYGKTWALTKEELK